MTKTEWIQQATLDCLVKIASSVLDRERAARQIVDLVVLVADELERHEVFPKTE